MTSRKLEIDTDMEIKGGKSCGLASREEGDRESWSWSTAAAKAWSLAYKPARRRVTVSLSPEKAFHLLQRASMLSSEM